MTAPSTRKRLSVARTRAFVDHVRREHDDAPPPARISPVAMLVRDGAPTAVLGELQLNALAAATGGADRTRGARRG